jgi:hypothetical protein
MNSTSTDRYAKVIEVSKRVRWEIDRDIIRGRGFDYSRHFLPDGLSLVDELPFLSSEEQRLLSQVQGRTYANMFALVERFITAKVMELGRAQALADQVATEALVGMTEEELKHQKLFRRLESMMGQDMPSGYVMSADPDAIAHVVLGSGNWAVLALTLYIELFSLAHYRASIASDEHICPMWKDVFLYHWREESQHAILDEMEFLKEDARLDADGRDAAVGELIALVGAVDGTVQVQAEADAGYFCAITGLSGHAERSAAIHALVLKAYRWQYVVSGLLEPRFNKVLFSCLNAEQATRIRNATAPFGYAMPRQPGVAEAMAA